MPKPDAERAVGASEQRHATRSRGPAWKVLRLLALGSNLLYVAGAVVGLVILGGLGPAPWAAYRNVVLFIVVAAAAAVMNVKGIRKGLGVGASVVAVALNALCLAFLLLRPEYAFPALKVFVALVPILNVLVLAGGWGSVLPPHVAPVRGRGSQRGR